MRASSELYPIVVPEVDPMLITVRAEACGHKDEVRKIKHGYCGHCISNDPLAWKLNHPGLVRRLIDRLFGSTPASKEKAAITPAKLHESFQMGHRSFTS